MGALIRAFDWSQTAIGPMESWSPTLRTMIRFVLANRFPLLLWWGPHYISIYNDAYRPVLGAKHPWALGRPVSECWSEIWHVLKPLIDTPFNGGPATWNEDIELEINRHGFLEETHFTIAYSPVPDEAAAGGIGGVLATVNEITEKVIGERRIITLRDLASRTGEARTPQEACTIAADTLARHARDIPFALFFLLDGDHRLARLAGAAGLEPGQTLSPEEVSLRDADTGQGWHFPRSAAPLVLDDLPSRFPTVPSERFSALSRTAVVLPIAAFNPLETAGFLVIGVNQRLKLDDHYHDFLQLMKAQVASAIANARSYEQERKRAEALAEIDRAKTAFFSNVSHEFRTPLTLMLGPIEEMLRSPSAVSPSQRENLATAHGNALRLLKLVNSLLDFARVEAGRAKAVYQPTDLSAFTTELASSFESLCRRAGLDLVIDCPPLSQRVYVDRDIWEKIVLNLVSNAFKFTFQGRISLTLREDRGAAVLTVSDTGTGIPEAELPHVFERFHRVDGVVGRTHEGSGIGLALVQELAKLHGGSVEVQSTERKGSSFTVRIPFGTAHLPRDSVEGRCTQASTATRSETFVAEAARWMAPTTELQWEQEVNPVAAPAAADRPRVLIADDNSDMRGYLQRLLSPYYDIEAAENGEAALAAARTRRPDLILADVMMPGLDGFGLLARLRGDGAFRDLPIILLSARAGEESRVEGLAAGADDYLTKPFSARELLARIESNIKLASVRRTITAEAQARLREFEALVSATSDAVYRMSADWTEMRYLLGRDFMPSTEKPTRSWLDTYIDPADQAIVLHAIHEAIRKKAVFELEHRVRRVDGSLGWTFSRAIPLVSDGGEIIEWLGTASDVTERRRAQEQQQLLVRELSHRVKNLFAIAGGMVALSARAAKTPEEMAKAVRGRLDALARAHELAIPALNAVGGTPKRGTTLDALVRAICSPYLDGRDDDGIVAQGPPARLAGQAVTSFALVLNELATNAAKYGALSTAAGRIEIKWTFDDDVLSLTWMERDGPTVDGRPSDHGFGTVLARRSIEGQLGGAIDYDWARKGVRVQLSVPAERLLQ